MPILFFNEEIEFYLDNEKKVKNWLLSVIKSYKKKAGDLNYIFVNDDKILELNHEFLDHDYFTDILTFNYNENNKINGDIFISIETVESNSLKFGTSFSDELNRVLVHGVLHLVGFNDQTEDEKLAMRNEENKCLSLIA